MAKQISFEDFCEKFKPKKTTDDCYTPPTIYEVIKNWACKEYGIDPDKIVRPFYPGGDYENFDYAPDAVVLDNPPFSILAQICEFYLERGIPFFFIRAKPYVLKSKAGGHADESYYLRLPNCV